jgi:hypothetical protein
VNESQTFDKEDWVITAHSSDPQAPVLSAQVEVGAIPSSAGLNLVILADSAGVRLSWNRVPAPFYCIYSGSSPSEPSDHFETSVADTFVILPYTIQERVMFEVRLCDQSPPPQK